MDLLPDLIESYAARIGRKVAPDSTSRQWTRATREFLGEFSSAHGWDSPCVQAGRRDFLLDFIAFDRDSKDARLAVECESGSLGSTLFNFRKLLYVKCETKILFCGPSSGNARLPELLAAEAAGYVRHTIGETYLVLDVRQSDQRIRSFAWTVSGNPPFQVEFTRFRDDVPFAFSKPMTN